MTGRLPAARTPPAERLDDALVLDVLSRLAGAGSAADVAAAVLAPLVELDGVRAACVVVRDGEDAVVVGSAGYDCDSMAPGARLPLGAGLPVTEAVRTGRTVVQGTGPSWAAVPSGRVRRGALLLSLTDPPPGDEPLRRLERIGPRRRRRAPAHRRAGARPHRPGPGRRRPGHGRRPAAGLVAGRALDAVRRTGRR